MLYQDLKDRAALAASCRRCGAATVLFPGAAAPVTGQFSFRCAHCGADNETSTTDLVRQPIRISEASQAA